jgi:hypothetical protein
VHNSNESSTFYDRLFGCFMSFLEHTAVVILNIINRSVFIVEIHFVSSQL